MSSCKPRSKTSLESVQAPIRRSPGPEGTQNPSHESSCSALRGSVAINRISRENGGSKNLKNKGGEDLGVDSPAKSSDPENAQRVAHANKGLSQSERRWLAHREKEKGNEHFRYALHVSIKWEDQLHS